MQNASLSLDHVNGMSAVEFVADFGGIAEHSPWVAEVAGGDRPYEKLSDMIGAFGAAVLRADKEEQLALIRAHPDLAGKAAMAGKLTDDSTSEQTSAGLDTLTAEEFERFQSYNTRYLERFGFPFILAVKGATKYDIIKSFEDRLGNDQATEFQTALEQIVKITCFRLEERIHD